MKNAIGMYQRLQRSVDKLSTKYHDISWYHRNQRSYSSHLTFTYGILMATVKLIDFSKRRYNALHQTKYKYYGLITISAGVFVVLVISFDRLYLVELGNCCSNIEQEMKQQFYWFCFISETASVCPAMVGVRSGDLGSAVDRSSWSNNKWRLRVEVVAYRLIYWNRYVSQWNPPVTSPYFPEHVNYFS